MYISFRPVPLSDWPGRETARTTRQWSALIALIEGVSQLGGVDGLLLIGSLAAGTADELSDIDVIVVTARGSFEAVWERRHVLSKHALIAWDLDLDGKDHGGHNWLTPDLVKVDCTVLDPDSGAKPLASPYVLCVGSDEIVGRFPQVSLAVVQQNARRAAAEQNRLPNDPETMPYGELIDWRISEFKHAVRRGRARRQA